MQKKFYIYRFIDENENIIYIGRTNDISRRILKEHFTPNTHLPNECYLETARVEYVEFEYESEEVAYEAILINKEKPKYNTQFNDIAEFDIKLPIMMWRTFEWEYKGQLEILKSMKKKTNSIRDVLAPVLLSEKYTGSVSLGFADIDEMVFLEQTSTVLVAAPSNTYKTTYALNIAISNAKNGKHVLYVNLKDSAEMLICRILSAETSIDIYQIYSKLLTNEDWKNICEVSSFLDSLPITFYNRSICGNSLSDIEKIIHEEDYDLIILDDLNSISDFECSYDSDKTLCSMNRIKGIALDAKKPMVLLYSIYNKSLNTRADPRPMISDLNNSMISYSDVIQFLHRNTTEPDSSKLAIITAKNHIGLTGIVSMEINDENLVIHKDT